MIFSDLLWAIENKDFEEIVKTIAEAELVAQLRLVESMIKEFEKWSEPEIPKDLLLSVLIEERAAILNDLRLVQRKKPSSLLLPIGKALEVKKP